MVFYNYFEGMFVQIQGVLVGGIFVIQKGLIFILYGFFLLR